MQGRSSSRITNAATNHVFYCRTFGHSTRATGAATTYPILVADRGLVGDFSPQTALILQMQNVNGHIALRYSDADKAKITAWLDQELVERR